MPPHPLSTGAKVWCWVCLIANFVAALKLVINTIEYYSYLSDIDLGLIIIVVILSYTAFAGYIALLAGKKAGFYLICACAIVICILNIIDGAYIYAICCFVNPLITWLVIRKTLPNWNEIAVARKTAKLQRKLAKLQSKLNR